jgi:large subunit ribosomal protein L10
MPKTRVQKEAILAQTVERLSRSACVVFVTVEGVKVNELEGIRDALFPQGLQLQVAKNSLFKKALSEHKLDVPTELLDQPVGMVYSYEDAVAAAKLMAPFVKDIQAMNVVGGLMDGKFLEVSQIQALSTLPSREQLLGQVVGTIAAPLSGLVNVLQGNIRGLVTALGQIRDAKA